MKENKEIICIVGLGYVGFPLADAFSRYYKVIGFDIEKSKINSLKKKYSNINFTSDPADIKLADFIILTVPTPIKKSKEPDLSYVESASRIVGRNLKKNSIVILESTVTPGVTEEIVGPILEQESGMVLGMDFKVGYSPERINPGDMNHTINKITKVVAGMDDKTTDVLADLYGKITNVYKARSIKIAESAKVIENIQRDLNIALVNELSIIFQKMELDTNDILDTASTKWNFSRYEPGMVGGHCIPVDPYYLVYKAKELGYHSQVILAGRSINDYMPRYIANLIIKALIKTGKVIKGSRILIMGLTFKANVDDIRETPIKYLIKELKEYHIEVLGFDPLLKNKIIEKEFDIFNIQNLKKIRDIDGIVITSIHNAFKKITLDDLKIITNENPCLIDIKRLLNKEEAKKKGFFYQTL